MVNIHTIDARTWVPGYSSVYLVADRRIALIETGISYSADVILQGIKDCGVRPEDISHILLTHVHLDHMGGAAILAKRMPQAEVLVHPMGVKHVIDPTRLINSAKAALGELSKVYGLEAVTGLDAGRVRPVREGDAIDLGGTKLTVLETPGHAPHHLCFHESSTNGVFFGDLGGYSPGGMEVYPSSPAPDFDPELSIQSVERVKSLKPEVLYFSHFGAHGHPEAAMDGLIRKIREWDIVARKALDEGLGAEYFVKFVARDTARGPRSEPTWLHERMAESGALGFLKYYEMAGKSEIRSAKS